MDLSRLLLVWYGFYVRSRLILTPQHTKSENYCGFSVRMAAVKQLIPCDCYFP